jgi:hypothetical protein
MRLSANFVNLEVTVTGVPKLRIPITLLREKQRTAKRFSVTLFHCPYVTEIPTLPKFLSYRNSYLIEIIHHPYVTQICSRNRVYTCEI